MKTFNPDFRLLTEEQRNALLEEAEKIEVETDSYTGGSAIHDSDPHFVKICSYLTEAYGFPKETIDYVWSYAEFGISWKSADKVLDICMNCLDNFYQIKDEIIAYIDGKPNDYYDGSAPIKAEHFHDKYMSLLTKAVKTDLLYLTDDKFDCSKVDDSTYDDCYYHQILAYYLDIPEDKIIEMLKPSVRKLTGRARELEDEIRDDLSDMFGLSRDIVDFVWSYHHYRETKFFTCVYESGFSRLENVITSLQTIKMMRK